MLSLIAWLCGCQSKQQPQPVASPANPIKSALLVVSGVNGTESKPEKAFFRWEIRGASDVKVSFAGQTLHLMPAGQPMTITLGFRKGPSAQQVTVDLAAKSGGSSSSTSVNIGAGPQKDFTKLIRSQPAERQIEVGKQVVLGEGVNAFPSLYVQAKQ